MRSQDFLSEDNERGRVLKLMRDFCAEHDLSYEYTEKEFTVKLPAVDALPTELERAGVRGRRKEFDFLKPDPHGVDETSPDPFPDELPPTTIPLDEGEPPKGDDEK